MGIGIRRVKKKRNKRIIENRKKGGNDLCINGIMSLLLDI